MQKVDSIDSNGDISIHSRETLVIEYFFRDRSDAPINMTGRTVLFETEHGLMITLTVGSAANSRLLIIPAGFLSILSKGSYGYIIMDDTANANSLLLEAEINIRGF